jgi:DNA repair exonuclease SbcCD ATPase subunit
MDNFQGSSNILDYLILITKEIAANNYEMEKKLFDLTRTGKYPQCITDLAESFGTMIVKLEGREIQLEKTIDDLQNASDELQQQILTRSRNEAKISEERNGLEDLVRKRRDELLKINHQLKLEIIARKNIEEIREKLIVELSGAITRLKQLKKLLPICSACKKIRDDEGFWINLESYLQNYTEAEFSHGLCTRCLKKLYPEQYQRLVAKGKIAPVAD